MLQEDIKSKITTVGKNVMTIKYFSQFMWYWGQEATCKNPVAVNNGMMNTNRRDIALQAKEMHKHFIQRAFQASPLAPVADSMLSTLNSTLNKLNQSIENPVERTVAILDGSKPSSNGFDRWPDNAKTMILCASSMDGKTTPTNSASSLCDFTKEMLGSRGL